MRSFMPIIEDLCYTMRGKGKLTWLFSAQCWQIFAPRLLALPTEAWQGAEICICSVENGYVDFPGPHDEGIRIREEMKQLEYS